MDGRKLNKYVGARYVPIFGGEWDSAKTYEPLVVVTRAGASYTSKTFVPVGVDITDGDFWACTGNYNAQVEQYRKEVTNVLNVFNNAFNEINAFSLIDGFEYMYHYLDKLRMDDEVKIIYSGDSTTYGTNIADERYKIHNLTRTLLDGYGFASDVVNSGYENMNTRQWLDIYLDSDLAQRPDLYILRWGVNDGSVPPVSSRLDTFLNNLKSGLGTIRSRYNANELSIILMSPNSTDDVTNNRDAKWYNEIVPYLRQIAREYQCTFVDAYNFMYDCTNVVWTDTYSIGHIHPLETANMNYVSLLSDCLVPIAYRNMRHVFNIEFVNDWSIESGYSNTFYCIGQNVDINVSIVGGTNVSILEGGNFDTSHICTIPARFAPLENKVLHCVYKTSEDNIAVCEVLIHQSGKVCAVSKLENIQFILNLQYTR